jgi:hypothetical protein
MVPNPLDSEGPTALFDLVPNVGFVFSEAVADHSGAERLFLPDRNANVGGRERLTIGAEVDDRAAGLGTEAVLRGADPL